MLKGLSIKLESCGFNYPPTNREEMFKRLTILDDGRIWFTSKCFYGIVLRKERRKLDKKTSKEVLLKAETVFKKYVDFDQRIYMCDSFSDEITLKYSNKTLIGDLCNCLEVEEFYNWLEELLFEKVNLEFALTLRYEVGDD